MRRVVLSLLAATLVGIVALSFSLSQTRNTNSEIQRGRYLVEQVALCVDCHSPRDQKGEFVRARWLGGAPLDFKPTHPMPWAETAPPLAGLPGWKTEEVVRLLMTGTTPTGNPLRPPMPPYRLKREDASAVAAYLKSLPPVPVGPATTQK